MPLPFMPHSKKNSWRETVLYGYPMVGVNDRGIIGGYIFGTHFATIPLPTTYES